MRVLQNCYNKPKAKRWDREFVADIYGYEHALIVGRSVLAGIQVETG